MKHFRETNSKSLGEESLGEESLGEESLGEESLGEGMDLGGWFPIPRLTKRRGDFGFGFPEPKRSLF